MFTVIKGPQYLRIQISTSTKDEKVESLQVYDHDGPRIEDIKFQQAGASDIKTNWYSQNYAQMIHLSYSQLHNNAIQQPQAKIPSKKCFVTAIQVWCTN